MFFIFGMSSGCDVLNFRQNIICPCCGRYGSLEAFKRYDSFSLFFIPVFFWNKRYFVKTACCGSISPIDSVLGRRIEKGAAAEIDVSRLRFAQGFGFKHSKCCAACGYETAEDFAFCPKCGHRF